MHVCMYVCMFENFLDNFGKYIQTHPNHIHRHGHTNTKNSSYLGHPRTPILLPTSNGIKNHARTQFDKLDMERTSTLSKNPF